MTTVNLPEAPTGHVLHCLDRIVLTGTAIGLHHAGAMKYHLQSAGYAKSEFMRWSQPITADIKESIKALAHKHAIQIIPWKSKYGRKDDLAKKAMAEKEGYGPILIIESFEKCRSYRYAKSKDDDRDFYAISTKCLHYYVYFKDKTLGLVHVRIQSYAPFPIQVILNGHRILERLLIQHKIRHTAEDNAIIACSQMQRAQELADSIDDDFIKKSVKHLVGKYLPCMDILPCGYRLTIRQIEYSSDIIFTEDPNIYQRYNEMIPRLLQNSPNEILRFIQCDGTNPKKPVESRAYQTRFGACIKFSLGSVSIKTYTKNKHVIRVETTVGDMTALRGLRTVHHEDGQRSIQRKQLTRSIHDLQLFINYAKRANNRFIETMHVAMSRHYETRGLEAITESKRLKGRAMKGFNFYNPIDQKAVQAIANPKLDLLPFSRKTFADLVGNISPGQASHIIRRLRCHGMIKKLPRSRLYYPTELGKKACLTMIYLNQEVVRPIIAA